MALPHRPLAASLAGLSLLMAIGLQAQLQDPVARLEAMRARDPQDAVVLYTLAAHAASAGRTSEAIDLLDQVSRAPGGLDPSFARAFWSMHGEPRFEGIVARIRAANPPRVRSTTAVTIAERDLHPEGIAFDPVSHSLFLGSFKGKIIRIDRDGRATDFAYLSRPEARRVVVGIRVDGARRHPWASVADPRAFGDTTVEGTALVQLGLDSGTLVRTWRGGGGAFNDVVVAPNGDAFATNTTDGSVWRAHAGVLSPFLPAGTIEDANGITITPDGRLLLVAGWHDIHRVDVGTRDVRPLQAPAGVITGSVDGLYWHDGALIAVQNGIHPGRIVRFALDPTRRRITAGEILEQYHPQFGGMTTAALDGNSLLYIVNTQSRAFDAEGRVKDGVTLRDIVVARLPLGPPAAR